MDAAKVFKIMVSAYIAGMGFVLGGAVAVGIVQTLINMFRPTGQGLRLFF